MTQLVEAGLAEGVVREHRFCPPRLWRFDFAWPSMALAVEIEGGAFIGGRHTRGAGFRGDAEKYATALLLGWRVLRVPDMWIRPPKGQEAEAVTWTRALLERVERITYVVPTAPGVGVDSWHEAARIAKGRGAGS